MPHGAMQKPTGFEMDEDDHQALAKTGERLYRDGSGLWI